MTCCSYTGSVIKFHIYTGAPTDDELVKEKAKKKANKTSSTETNSRLVELILSIIPPSFHHSGKLIAFDNYYNYFSMHAALDKIGVYALGTFAHRGKPPAIPGRGNFPMKYDKADCDKLNKGWFRQAVQSISGTKQRLLALVWRDNKLVSFLSGINVFSAPSWTKALRKTKTSNGLREEVPAHPVSVLYNQYMGGVDLFDYYMACYPLGHKARRWYMRVFFWLLNMSIVVVFIYIKRRGGKEYDLCRKTGGAHFNFRVMLQNELYYLACVDLNYQKVKDKRINTARIEEMLLVQAEDQRVEALEQAKRTRHSRAVVVKKPVQPTRISFTPAKQGISIINQHNSSSTTSRSKSPPNYIPLGTVNLDQIVFEEKRKKTSKHILVPIKGGGRLRCKLCVMGKSASDKRVARGHKEGNNKGIYEGKTKFCCSFHKCNSIPLCKKHLEQHIESSKK